MAGLMYPAYQKYYSAICNLKRFGIEKNFFDNISILDNFFRVSQCNNGNAKIFGSYTIHGNIQ